MTDDKQTAIRFLDGLVIDEDTGEILEWPDGFLGGDRVASLMGAYHDAKEQAERWEVTANLVKFALTRIAEETGARKLTDESGTVTLVAEGKTRKVPANRLTTARQAELLSDDQVAYVAISAAKELDVAAVETALGMIATELYASNVEAGVDEAQAGRDSARWRDLVMAMLVVESPRKGYTLVKPAAKRVAVLERETVEPFDGGSDDQ